MDNKSLIITCGCGDTTDYAKTGYKIRYGEVELPPVIEMNNENRCLIELLLDFFPFATKQAIDLDQPFAFSVVFQSRYSSYDENVNDWFDNMEYEVFDLLNGIVL